MPLLAGTNNNNACLHGKGSLAFSSSPADASLGVTDNYSGNVLEGFLSIPPSPVSPGYPPFTFTPFLTNKADLRGCSPFLVNVRLQHVSSAACPSIAVACQVFFFFFHFFILSSTLKSKQSSRGLHPPEVAGQADCISRLR